MVAPFAALADSFTIKPVELELGKPATLEFNLQNDQVFYGFQADVKLPEGLTVKKVELSDRASAEGQFKLNYKTVSNGSLRITAFSGNHTAFTGDDGVLINMEISVANNYKGGNIEISGIIFTDKNNKDVSLSDTSLTPTVAVTGITLSPSSLALKVGGTEKLTATIVPAIATDNTVTWTSSDSTIASVNDGVVTAVAEGNATITAKSSNGITATCEVAVATNVIEVESVTLNETALSLKEGGKATLMASILPENATNKAVTWTSSDTSVATVNYTTGEVTAVKAGTATITATTSNAKITATCSVTVSAIDAESVELDKTTLKLKVGETDTLTASVAPENTSDKTVIWSSSDEAIASVKDGVVTAIALGGATITATCGTVSAICKVSVIPTPVESITLSEATLNMTSGDKKTLTATVKPEDATDQTITWSSSDEKVATVSENGEVTALQAGTATITAKAGEVSATCEVIVSAVTIAIESIELSNSKITVEKGDNFVLSCTIKPAEATDKNVVWTSSNPAVATVDENGNVKSVSTGETVITAKAGEKTATCNVTVETVKAPEAGIASVKMTYVNKSLPNTSYGIIKNGENALSGFNKISGESVAFANEGWNVNYITYLQVDASAIEGNITSATLSFEGSGSTDSKRTTSWGVGYNSTAWSSTMTYDSADRGITVMGSEKAGSSKSATSFNSFSFDITEAVKNAENGIATIIVYETAAGGGYIKNPTVEISATNETVYNVTFKETNGIAATVTIDGKDVTKGTSLANGTYSFSATATGYQDYTGEFTVEGADKNVEFTMAPKATLNYTVKNNVNDVVNTGTCLEGASVTVPYSRYILAADGTVWKREASNKEYNFTFTPDADNYVATIEYSATETKDGIYFIEGEDIEGMTVVTKDNANIRCSNAAGGYSATPVNVYTLKPGTYNLAMGVFGNAGATFVVKAGEETILSADTKGYWYEENTKEPFSLKAETTLTFEGCASNKPLDYILITGTVGTPVSAITLDKQTLEIAKGSEAQLTATVAPENAFVKDLTWSSSDEKIATVDQTGKVKAIEGGSAVITVASAAYPEIKAECKVTVTIPVSGLAILDEDDNVLDSTHSLALITGDEYTLTEVVSPENATEQRVTWTSSDEKVAKIVDIVEEPHQVHIDAIAPGEATITASLAGFSTSFKVTVSDPVVPVKGIKLDKTTAEMKTGETLPLTATIEPEDASSKEVKWTSSDNTTATVSAKGVVKALKAGKVTITATANKLTATCEITITDIEVAYITLDKTEANLVKGETVQLTATVTPTNATNPTVVWSSDNEKVATVDQTGKVTAVGGGEAVITAKAGDKTATCKVTVTVPVTGLVLLDEDEQPLADGALIEFHTGHEYNLTAVVNPEDATDKTVTWTTSDETVIAFLDDEGLMDGLKAGEATVTASIAGFSVSVNVKVTDPVIPVTGIKLDKTTAEMITGETLELKATLEPTDATSKDITWTSSDKTIATVSTKGVVKALKAGKVTITATANKKSATCEITITDPVVEVEEITLDKTEATITIGETVDLKATVTPENATDATVTWTSSDESIATVDEFGTVTGIAEGTVVITAKAGDKTAECKVTVNKTSAVKLIGLDPEAPVKVFDLNGIYVGETMEGLQQGTYIVRQGNVAKKVRVR